MGENNKLKHITNIRYGRCRLWMKRAVRWELYFRLTEYKSV